MYAHLGYPQIVLLMAMESSLFPVPAELVMIPAGYFARQGRLDAGFAIACGAFGSLVGAGVNYWLGRSLGRPFLLHYGRYLLIDSHKYERAEKLFLRHARLSVFLGRLLPGVRQLISWPAGAFRMPGAGFALLTALGAGLYCVLLVASGYYFGEAAIEWITRYMHQLAWMVLGALAIGAIWFLARKV